MEPFRVAAPLKELVDPYPPAATVVEAAKVGGDQARVALARLWLSEGIPCAFRQCPAVYEAMRSWLASWLKVHAKEIGVAGSGRLGTSLSPAQLGKPFDSDSDLDLFVVSASAFERLQEEFRRWSFDFEGGSIVPDNEKEKRFWQDNNARGPKLIQRGFLDQKMIPNREGYPVTKMMSQAMYLLTRKLRITALAPSPKRASIRCYSSWESFVRQATLNLS
jgi:hypothetical protein